MSDDRNYSDPSLGAIRQIHLPGNSGTALLLTPQAGTGVETKTHTTTLDGIGFGVKAKLKKLVYVVKTAATNVAGHSLTLDVYNGTDSVGSLSVTTQAALSVITSSDIDSVVAAGGYIRVRAKSLTTASDAQNAIGFLYATYQEMYAG